MARGGSSSLDGMLCIARAATECIHGAVAGNTFPARPRETTLKRSRTKSIHCSIVGSCRSGRPARSSRSSSRSMSPARMGGTPVPKRLENSETHNATICNDVVMCWNPSLFAMMHHTAAARGRMWLFSGGCSSGTTARLSSSACIAWKKHCSGHWLRRVISCRKCQHRLRCSPPTAGTPSAPPPRPERRSSTFASISTRSSMCSKVAW
mmetsp:Transcript_30912/g.88315  ORF Transcript_30912/g.88315 Transcript_30912/m.88315 type:complete len:208 (+) Transcript_30912:334-957(+)